MAKKTLEEITQIEETLTEQKEDLVEELEVIETQLEDVKEEKAQQPWPQLHSLWEDKLVEQLAKVDSSHIEKGAIKAIINGLIS